MLVSVLSNEIRIAQLSKRLRPVSDEQDANAAVALILSQENSNFSILFVKRVENLADPWSGQIGLPGGKREAVDKNLKQCVTRETLEETGIALSEGRFLGLLPALRSMPRPELMILPFVVLVEHKPVIRLNEEELQSFIWIRLQQIIASRNTVKIGSREMPAFVVGETVIWGLTYRIIENFIPHWRK